MIINGGSRSNGGYFAKHLMRDDHNSRVDVIEIRGLLADNVRDAFHEMRVVASGTRCTNYFYHANLNTRDDERLSDAQWTLAVDRLERELGLTGQPRLVVEHEKDGRVHRHVVWSRIDLDSMTAISDSLTYPKHERVARELEELFGHEPVESVLQKDRGTPRPERNPKDWESLRGSETQLDPKAIKAHVTGLWHSADSGTAFAAALADNGYILVRGDRRDFCIIDAAGKEHSLARRLAGVKAAVIRERLADIDRDALPSVAEGRVMALAQQDMAGEGDEPAALPPVAAEAATHTVAAADTDYFAEVRDRLVRRLQDERDALGIAPSGPEPGPAGDDFQDVLKTTIARAKADAFRMEWAEATGLGDVFERVMAWLSDVRDHISAWGEQLWSRWRGDQSSTHSERDR